MEYLSEVRQPLSAYLKRYQTELIWPTGVPCSDLIVEALQDRDFHVFSWLLAQAFPDFGRFAVRLESLSTQAIMEAMMNHASSGNHTNVLIWMLDNGFQITDPALSLIDRSPEIMDSIDWNRNDRLLDAACGGHMNCVKYAESAGIKFSSMMCNAAAAGGQLEVLKYLREQGCPWSGELLQSCMEGIVFATTISSNFDDFNDRYERILACMDYARSNGLEAA